MRVIVVPGFPDRIIEDEPRGLGDTIANFTHVTGLDKLAHKYTELTGRDCGCQQRRELLNKLVPYD